MNRQAVEEMRYHFKKTGTHVNRKQKLNIKETVTWHKENRSINAMYAETLLKSFTAGKVNWYAVERT
jgi:nitric oxide synthase oxygenase domain/subunit